MATHWIQKITRMPRYPSIYDARRFWRDGGMILGTDPNGGGGHAYAGVMLDNGCAVSVRCHPQFMERAAWRLASKLQEIESERA